MGGVEIASRAGVLWAGGGLRMGEEPTCRLGLLRKHDVVRRDFSLRLHVADREKGNVASRPQPPNLAQQRGLAAPPLCGGDERAACQRPRHASLDRHAHGITGQAVLDFRTSKPRLSVAVLGTTTLVRRPAEVTS